MCSLNDYHDASHYCSLLRRPDAEKISYEMDSESESVTATSITAIIWWLDGRVPALAPESTKRFESVRHWLVLLHAAYSGTDVHRSGARDHLYRQSADQLRPDLRHQPVNHASGFLRGL